MTKPASSNRPQRNSNKIRRAADFNPRGPAQAKARGSSRGSGAGALKLGVLISGGGTTLENLINRIRDGRLRRATIALVISSRGNVRGVDITRQAGLPLEIIRKREHPEEAAFSDAITAALDQAGVDLAVLAGFLCFWRLPPHFEGQVLNIHPALLPAFGGKGMYGLRVHAAVLKAGQTESGCTVHLVDNQYDHGPVVAQTRVPVQPDDNPETLARRVGIAERELYPQVIQQVADNGLEWLKLRQASIDG
ncbi:MAG: phosphoribosylglycinamide formyltransferase [Phycisphaerae bacterium]|nr:phosphoribosylglycinamide formyltransferase [Phycisphaerae bacterium]